MAVDDKPDQKPEDDGMADWAEALQEQKTSDKGPEVEPGGVLSGEAARPFSSSDAPASDINMVLDIPVQLSVELGRTKVDRKSVV